MRNVFNRRIRQSTARLKEVYKNLKAAVHEAKNKWMRITKHKNWNKIVLGCNKHLKGGFSETKPSSSNQIKCPDSSFCQTPKENSEVFCDHFQTLYGR